PSDKRVNGIPNAPVVRCANHLRKFSVDSWKLKRQVSCFWSLGQIPLFLPSRANRMNSSAIYDVAAGLRHGAGDPAVVFDAFNRKFNRTLNRNWPNFDKLR